MRADFSESRAEESLEVHLQEILATARTLLEIGVEALIT
jgi:hypothetical protein